VTTEPSPTIPETKADGPSLAVDPRAAIDAIPRAYNFADDILERNLKAGRANKPVYVDPRGAWTYGQLAERVGRFGCVLRSLGIRREERVLLALLDTIDWPTAFLGAIKAGIVPIPINTLMTEDDYRFVLTDSRAKALVVSEALYPKFANLIGSVPDLMPVIVSGAGRYLLLALHLRLDWEAQGRGACPCQIATHRRPLCGRGPGPEIERCLLFRGEALFRVRAWQCLDLSHGGRRHHHSLTRAPHARRRHHDLAHAFGHGVLCGPNVLCRLPRQSRRSQARGFEAPLLHFWRRGFAGSARPALEGTLWSRHSRRHRLDRNAAHLPLELPG
jgi:hypothetical protein